MSKPEQTSIMAPEAALPEQDIPKGFISVPTAEQMKPSKAEVAYLDSLWEWQQRSAKNQRVWH